MKLVLFETSERREPTPGLLTERGIVGLADTVERGHTPQLTMHGLIDQFERLRPALGAAGVGGRGPCLSPLSGCARRASHHC
jgi:hypothetical protein